MEERTEKITVRYRREMNHNFMIIDSPMQEVGGYESKMLVSNGIEGLLKLRIRYHDDRKEFYYEITSKQPLKRLLEQKLIKGKEIRGLILGIAAALHKIEEYLLKEEQFLLDPEYIYIEPDRFEIYLCIVPGYSCDFPAALTSLLQYILGRTDHQDKDGVVLAYNLYHESLKENYGMPDLLNYLMQEKEVIFGGGFAEERSGEPEILTGEPEWMNQTRMSNQRIEESQPDFMKPAWGEQRDREVGKGERNRENRVNLKNEEKRECITESRSRENVFIKMVKVIVCVAAGEILLWFMMGEAGLLQYGIWVGIGIVGTALMAGLLHNKAGKDTRIQINGNQTNEKEDGRKQDERKQDGRKQDGRKQDGRKQDGRKQDGGRQDERRQDGRKQGGIKQDGRKQDGREQDGRKQDGREQDGRKQDGRKQDNRYQDKEKRDKQKQDKNRRNYIEQDSWRMVFDENQSEELFMEKEREEGREEGRENGRGEKEKPDEPETTLLADFSGDVCMARFDSLSREQESIEISYLPFVIGKYEELSDYCLQQSTISRLHLRLDKKEGVYIITDLNSTNGTTVNGYQLQANETVSIKSGDTIYLADLGYRFSELIK